MDLGLPMRSVVPSIDAYVYEVLANTISPLSARAVFALTNGPSYSGVKKALHRMVDHGLVYATDAPPAVLYQANREHLAWEAIERLSSLRVALLDRMREAIRGWPDAPVGVVMFGSAARGDGDPDSDIDLLALCDQDDRDQIALHLADLADSVRGWTGNEVQTAVFTSTELESLDARVLDNIRNDAIVLSGDARVLR